MGEDPASGQEKRVAPLSAGYERLCPEREELPAELTVDICFKFRGRGFQEFFAEDETVSDLAGEIELVHEIPVANQKYLVPKLGLIKPSEHPDRPVSYLQGKVFQLVGTEAQRVKSFQDAAQRAADRRAARAAARHARRSGARRTQPSQEELAYTFLDVRPLRFLPNPQRSLDLLNRLRDDPGIRGVMKKHKFTVQLLTEMEPVSNTQESHEGTTRLLGLNRNKGEVIELRLRTDNHQGYRDYKTIRKTLCHELAHNVHGPHDRKFWDLCHQIEREVEVGSGGQALGEESYFQPSGEDDHAEDEGGWTGGEYVLGGGRVEGLSRREILAKAAEERLKRMNATRPDGGRREPGPS